MSPAFESWSIASSSSASVSFSEVIKELSSSSMGISFPSRDSSCAIASLTRTIFPLLEDGMPEILSISNVLVSSS
ncbi:MAG: hypothetical protein HC944_06620 [Nanoarchaeota archaeon]|nr:hypothetical protein [Nanoarchaeota archaeon]